MLDWIKTRIRNIAQLPEKTIIKKIQAGDTQAFETLYLTYLDQIYRYIFFRVHQDQHLAEDITETVFMKAWQHINEFNSENGSFKAWVYQIARNAVVDHYRMHKTTTQLDDEHAVQSSENFEENMYKRVQHQQILDAIKHLTDEQQEVVSLRFIDDLSYAEIASLTGKNEDAIRALNYRGLQTLRKELHHD